MTTGDLASYAAKPRPPLCATYRGYRICSMGPSSGGGSTMLSILKLLERFDMAKLGKESPVAWHLFAEASRLAYADRDMYLGDPDYVRVPIKGLFDPAYIASRSALISPDRTMASVSPGTPPGAPPRVRAPVSEVPGTTDLVTVDAAGNVAEVTTTVEGSFGSGLSVDGTMLNNELTDFDIVPVKDGDLVANRVEGGKRPRSSMSPTIVYGPDGKVRLAVGAAGGSTIIAQVAKAIIGVIDWKLSAQDAIAQGLLFAPYKVATVEQGTSLEALVPGLQAGRDGGRRADGAEGQCHRAGRRPLGRCRRSAQRRRRDRRERPDQRDHPRRRQARSPGGITLTIRQQRARSRVTSSDTGRWERHHAYARIFPQSRHHVLHTRRREGGRPLLWRKGPEPGSRSAGPRPRARSPVWRPD